MPLRENPVYGALCCKAGLLRHLSSIRTNHRSLISAVNLLLSVCTNISRLDLARRIFNSMPEKDLVSYNSLLFAYAGTGNWIESFRLFRMINGGDLVPNRVSFLGVSVACGHARDVHLGSSIHGRLIRVGLIGDLRLGTSILDTYAKCGMVDSARAVFDVELRERSLVSWNSLISGYVQNGYDHEAVDLYRRMLSECDVEPDAVTMANLISSLADLDLVRLIHGHIITRGIDSAKDVVLGTAMVDAYGKSTDLEAASFLFDRVEKANSATWNAMILGCNLNGRASLGLEYFVKLLLSTIGPDSITVVVLLQSCGELGSSDQGRMVHGYCISTGFDSYRTVGNALIGVYLRCNCEHSAWVLFNTMPLRDIVTWNTMLCGYIKIGCTDSALKLFRQMLLESQFRPDYITMISAIQSCGEPMHGLVIKTGFDSETLVANSLVDAYAKNGSMEKAWVLFEQMGPSRDHSSWNVMIAGCGMNGQGEGACMLLAKMEREGFRPNPITFISLLSSCSHSGMVEKGCEYFHMMTAKYGIQPKLEHYTCMIDMFARAGRLEEGRVLIERAPEGLECGAVWGALLNGCKMRSDGAMGEIAGARISRVEPENCGYDTLLSNVYASVGWWDRAVEVRRSVVGGERVVKKAGVSVVML